MWRNKKYVYFLRIREFLFSPEVLSLHNETVRTTSGLEEYNSYLCTQIAAHESFWAFLRFVKRDEFKKFTEFSQALDAEFNIFEIPTKKVADRSNKI